jgi:hypothetical protein
VTTAGRWSPLFTVANIKAPPADFIQPACLHSSIESPQPADVRKLRGSSQGVDYSSPLLGSASPVSSSCASRSGGASPAARASSSSTVCGFGSHASVPSRLPSHSSGVQTDGRIEDSDMSQLRDCIDQCLHCVQVNTLPASPATTAPCRHHVSQQSASLDSLTRISAAVVPL